MRWLALSAVLVGGCYRTTILSGRPISAAIPVIEDRSRGAIIGDIVEIDSPMRLDLNCPTGWASIEQWESGFNWLVNTFVGAGIYQANTATLRCAPSAAVAPVVAPMAAPPPVMPPAP